MKTFSVVIPTYNRPQTLDECLHSFTKLDYPRDSWELILVNDGGKEKLTASLNPYFQQALPLRILEVPHAGPAAARNAGARIATGAYLAFTDDDCMVASDWLEQFSRKITKDVGGVVGQILNPYPESLPAATCQLLIGFF